MRRCSCRRSSTPTRLGAIQAASDSFLRQAVAAVCAVEEQPTLWHVYKMLDYAKTSNYRETVVNRLDAMPDAEFALHLLGATSFRR